MFTPSVCASCVCTLPPPCQLHHQPSTVLCCCRPVVAKAGISKLRSKLVGVGSCAPPTRVTNVDLEDLVDTTDEWIAQRTGIRSRHLLAPGETMSELGSKAAERALEMAGVAAEDVDLVIFATSSADDLFGDAANVAKLVGATNAVAFDLTAACSGFLFGINTASQFLHNGAYKTALVIGGDALSRWVDWNDRSTCVLFGDGAGAVVLKAAATDDEAGILGWEMHSNGAGRKDLNLCYSGEPRELGDVAPLGASPPYPPTHPHPPVPPPVPGTPLSPSPPPLHRPL